MPHPVSTRSLICSARAIAHLGACIIALFLCASPANASDATLLEKWKTTWLGDVYRQVPKEETNLLTYLNENPSDYDDIVQRILETALDKNANERLRVSGLRLVGRLKSYWNPRGSGLDTEIYKQYEDVSLDDARQQGGSGVDLRLYSRLLIQKLFLDRALANARGNFNEARSKLNESSDHRISLPVFFEAEKSYIGRFPKSEFTPRFHIVLAESHIKLWLDGSGLNMNIYNIAKSLYREMFDIYATQDAESIYKPGNIFRHGRQLVWYNDALFGLFRLLFIGGEREELQSVLNGISNYASESGMFDPYGRECTDRVYVFRALPLNESTIVNKKYNPIDILSNFGTIEIHPDQTLDDRLSLFSRTMAGVGATGYKIIAATVGFQDEARDIALKINKGIERLNLSTQDDLVLFGVIEQKEGYIVQSNEIDHFLMNTLLREGRQIGIRSDAYPWRKPDC